MKKIKTFAEKYAAPAVVGAVIRPLISTGIRRLGLAAATAAAATVVALVSSAGPSPTLGVDFGWGGPSVAAMHSAGAKFGASYLSYDASKNWQRAQVSAYHTGGIATVVVWETGATRATAGFAAGASDARSATAQATALGVPSNRPIYYAIDCDCTGGQVASYFDGVNSVEGVSRTGAYGGYYPVKYLFDSGRIRFGWQTYAWSYGNRDSRAQLYQYSNSHLIGGRDVDLDHAYAADYGQSDAPAPAVQPDRYAYLDKTVRHFGQIHATEYWTVRTWDGKGCRHPARRPICTSSRAHAHLLRDRIDTVAHHRGWGGYRVAHRGQRRAWLNRVAQR